MAQHAHHPAHHADHGHDAHGADAEYLPTPGSSYEHTDADVGPIIRFGVWLVVIGVVTHIALGGALVAAISWTSDTGEPRYPLAAGRQPKPPAPQLQQYPDREMTAFSSVERQTLESYGWIDKEAGRVRLPIDEAIRLTLERGLPARAPETATDNPGMMATDSSSGRVLERRRQ